MTDASRMASMVRSGVYTKNTVIGMRAVGRTTNRLEYGVFALAQPE